MFNSKNLLQTKGCTMGTSCTISAPTYANVFMDHFEWKYIYPLIEGKSLTYFRYIDGIFLNWTGTKDELVQFFKDLNNKHPSMKFGYKASKDRIVFLDTEVNLHNSKLHTRIYRKETDRQHYVHINSEHPKPLKNSLPYSQVIWMKQISLSQTDLSSSLKEIKNNLINQG